MAEWYVILNPNAGRRRAARQRDALIAALTRAEIPFVLEQTHGVGDATLLAKAAIEQGYTQIAAVGGDGTFHEVVNGIMSHPYSDANRVMLALIPMGTGNDFVKSLGGFRSHDIVSAARQIATGKLRTVDVMQMTIGDASQHYSRYVLNDIGLGIHARVAAETFKITHLGGWKVYALALIRALLDYHPLPLSIRLREHAGGREWTLPEQQVLLTCVGNGRWQGAGFQLTPQAVLDDGLLDLCTIEAVGWFEIIRHFPRVRKGTHGNLPQVTMRQVEHVVLTSPKPLLVSCDGEIAATATQRVEITIVPRALSVVV